MKLECNDGVMSIVPETAMDWEYLRALGVHRIGDALVFRMTGPNPLSAGALVSTSVVFLDRDLSARGRTEP